MLHMAKASRQIGAGKDKFAMCFFFEFLPCAKEANGKKKVGHRHVDGNGVFAVCLDGEAHGKD